MPKSGTSSSSSMNSPLFLLSAATREISKKAADPVPSTASKTTRTDGRCKSRTIFVTVGTTRFEHLIEATTTDSAIQCMKNAGYTHLILQYGKGTRPNLPGQQQSSPVSMEIEMYDFKPSLADDMAKSELIISHAGAGTVMEALQRQGQSIGTQNPNEKLRRLVVVINAKLMDNHQAELAEAMRDLNYLYVAEDPKLLSRNETWDAIKNFQPTPYRLGDPYDFCLLLNDFLGFAVSKEP